MIFATVTVIVLFAGFATLAVQPIQLQILVGRSEL